MSELPVCEFIIEGNPDGPTLVFIHGWPDDASLWRNQVAHLSSRFRCAVLTLPNFGAQPVRAGGFNFPDLVQILATTLLEIQPRGKVTLVSHDWGAYIAYLLEQAYPDRIERLVSMDVGGHVGKPRPAAGLMIIAYQWALVFSWMVGGLLPPLGNLLSKGVGKIVRVPDRQRDSVRSRFNYPYFYLWLGLLLPWKRNSLLQRYRPQCPVLYLYGKRKPFQFHSDRWLALVEQSGGKVIGLDAGHWLQEARASEVNALISEWLGK